MNPSRWLEALLRTPLPSRDREIIAGSVVRATWGWAVLVGIILVGRYVLDDFVLSHEFDPRRAEITTGALGLTLCAAGVWAGWRTHRFAAAIVVAVAASMIGSLASMVYAAIVALAPIPAWSTPTELDDALFAVPLILIAAGALLGAAGGALGIMGVRGARIVSPQRHGGDGGIRR